MEVQFTVIRGLVFGNLTSVRLIEGDGLIEGHLIEACL